MRVDFCLKCKGELVPGTKARAFKNCPACYELIYHGPEDSVQKRFERKELKRTATKYNEVQKLLEKIDEEYLPEEEPAEVKKKGLFGV